MTKQEAIEDFLKNLRIAFNIAGLYTKEHPFFIKSAQEFKNKLDFLFSFVSPVQIEIINNSLKIAGETFTGAGLYEDLANMFHQRKLQVISIRKTVTTDELIIFLNKASLPSKEILKQGGLENILNREKIKNISAIELDYSQLLKGNNHEDKDLWLSLLNKAILKNDTQNLHTLAENFENIIGEFKTDELLENDETKENILKFLEYLKNKDKPVFSKCVKEMVKFALDQKNAVSETDTQKLKIFFNDLDENDFSDILSDELLNNERFDQLSLDLFSKFIDGQNPENIAHLTKQRFNTVSPGNFDKIKRKMDNLFSIPKGSDIPVIYRSNLSSLLKNLVFEDKAVFDRNSIKKSYRLILLDMLIEEQGAEKLSEIIVKLSGLLPEITYEKDFEYLKMMLECLKKKKPATDNFFKNTRGKISDFMEQTVWNGFFAFDIEYFLDILQKSYFGLDAYINEIFHKKTANPYILKLYLRFFPGSLQVFYEHLEKNHRDIEFLEEMIKSLKELNPVISAEIFERIYGFGNSFIKVEILKTIQNMRKQNTGFLLSIIKNGELPLKKEALIALRNNEEAKKTASGLLFSIPNRFGKKNNLLLENMLLTEELDLYEAKDYLTNLNKKRFFWNKNVRKKAGEILKKWAR